MTFEIWVCFVITPCILAAVWVKYLLEQRVFLKTMSHPIAWILFVWHWLERIDRWVAATMQYYARELKIEFGLTWPRMLVRALYAAIAISAVWFIGLPNLDAWLPVIEGQLSWPILAGGDSTIFVYSVGAIAAAFIYYGAVLWIGLPPRRPISNDRRRELIARLVCQR